MRSWCFSMLKLHYFIKLGVILMLLPLEKANRNAGRENVRYKLQIDEKQINLIQIIDMHRRTK